MQTEAPSLLDLPKSFLSRVLDEIGDFKAARSLVAVSQSTFRLVFELKPGAFVLWGSNAAVANKRLQQLLPLGGLRALLIPDIDESIVLPYHLQLPILKTAVLSYSCAELSDLDLCARHFAVQQCRRFSGVHRLFSSAQDGPLDSIIVSGPQSAPGLTSRLSIFLQQLQDCSSLQKLVLTIQCTSTAAAAALGQLTSLRSLRMCMDVSRDSEARLRQDSDTNWTAGSWAAAVQPLTGLTSLQLKLPVLLRAQDDLGLESLGQLRRLELLLEKPLTPGNGNAESLGGAAGGAQAASLFLQQPGLPTLQHLTRLVLSSKESPRPLSWGAPFIEEAEGSSPPENTMDVIGQLTNLCSLHITPPSWKFSLQQLQPLSGRCKLTELVLAQLAMGFSEPGRIDENGVQLSTVERAAVQAAMAASAALHKQQQPQRQQQQQQEQGVTYGSSTGDRIAGGQREPEASAVPPSASETASSEAAAAAAAAVAAGDSKVQLAFQVPLLPQLTVLRVTSLYWRLPLCILSARLEELAYTRHAMSSTGSMTTIYDEDDDGLDDMPDLAFDDSDDVPVWDEGPVTPGAELHERWAALYNIAHGSVTLGEGLDTPAAAAVLFAGSSSSSGGGSSSSTGSSGSGSSGSLPGLGTGSDSEAFLESAALSAAEAVIAALAAVEPVPLADAPPTAVYADVIRGLPGLRKLDVNATWLCKVVSLTSSPLAGVRELRLHMLGAVNLPPGGLPHLPSLTHLEFYLPDKRNWGGRQEQDYFAVWQHQRNVRKLVFQGPLQVSSALVLSHPGLVHRCMPHIRRLVFRECPLLSPECLQQVVYSKLSPYIEVVEGSNFGPSKQDEQQQQQQQQQLAVGGAGPNAGASSSSSSGSSVGMGWQLPGQWEGGAGNGSTAALSAAGSNQLSTHPAILTLQCKLAPQFSLWNVLCPEPGTNSTSAVQPLCQPGGAGAGVVLPRVLVEEWRHLGCTTRNQRESEAARAVRLQLQRQKQMRAVVAAAAEVGVVVKVVPAVQWQKWYHDLLD